MEFCFTLSETNLCICVPKHFVESRKRTFCVADTILFLESFKFYFKVFDFAKSFRLIQLTFLEFF